jgi:hypothetical protein
MEKAHTGKDGIIDLQNKPRKEAIFHRYEYKFRKLYRTSTELAGLDLFCA